MSLANRAAYADDLSVFQHTSNNAILGRLAEAQPSELTRAQRQAWGEQINILKESTQQLKQGHILFEYLIPRMGKRADNILLVGNTVIVLEFKVGASNYDQSAVRQTIDYALDLKNFQNACHDIAIVPILVATKAADVSSQVLYFSADQVAGILYANAHNLDLILDLAISQSEGTHISPNLWLQAGYHPTPTIVEASQALYRGHNVQEITRHEAGADNLGQTTQTLAKIIDHAQATGQKTICLVTGVPGAGKTLAGLNLASEQRKTDLQDDKHAVFLSGNGPLVKVLQEALARDSVATAKANQEPITKSQAEREVKSFIQNIHHFRDACVARPEAPVERVVVFDEAQRAWDLAQTSHFMATKKGYPDFNQSEPDFLISAMNRHEGWAVIVCLVGEGQEINTGEAGIEEWLVALRDHYPNWSIYLPNQIQEEGYLASLHLDDLGSRVHYHSSLHLGVSIRSFRSEKVANSIGRLLDGKISHAANSMIEIQQAYPICITRSLNNAKAYIRQQARGSERFGLLTSSGARRLKPLSIAAGGVKGNECNWFLNDDQDVRSSFYLEDAATEFEVQGLELDWAIVVWDGDLIHNADAGWHYRTFKGTKWQNIKQEAAQKYRLNAYRVILTRARQGMVIVVPNGDPQDHTRLPSFYDPTWSYLKQLNLQQLETSL